MNAKEVIERIETIRTELDAWHRDFLALLTKLVEEQNGKNPKE